MYMYVCVCVGAGVRIIMCLFAVAMPVGRT